MRGVSSVRGKTNHEKKISSTMWMGVDSLVVFNGEGIQTWVKDLEFPPEEKDFDCFGGGGGKKFMNDT